MADAEPSSPSCAASCSAVCSTSATATAAEASPPPSVGPPQCAACGGPTTSVASPPPWTDAYNPPAYRPIRAPAINAPTQTNAIILTPVPPAISPYDFETPTKRVSSPDDIHHFHSSASGHHFLGFITTLSHSVRGCKIADPVDTLKTWMRLPSPEARSPLLLC